MHLRNELLDVHMDDIVVLLHDNRLPLLQKLFVRMQTILAQRFDNFKHWF
jgi:hypothetical protein